MNLTDPLIFFSILTAVNVVAYLLNFIISKVWNAINNLSETLTKNDIFVSIKVMFLNVLIAIPGFLLWTNDYILFTGKSVLLSFIFLFFLVDFLMYLTHWLSHKIVFFKQIHAKHHEHSEKFNSVSLYYMSSWESILFGLLLTVVVYAFQFNLYGFIVFLIFNWLYGLISHLNTTTNKSNFLVFNTNVFHKKHHQLNSKNYGFYTFIWDKLFGTDYLTNNLN